MQGGWIKQGLAVMLAVTLLGCGALSGGKRSSNYQMQMLAFENAMRWGEFQSADKFRKRGPGAAPTDFGAYEGIRVSAYRVLSTAPSPDGNRVVRTVKIDYYRETSPGVRSVTQRQVWEYDPEAEVWMLAGPLPVLD